MTSASPERRETDWLFQRLNALEDKISDQHRRLRDDMSNGFKALAHDIAERVSLNERRGEDHSARLLTIEVERRAEAAQSVKRGALAGMLAATGLQALMKAIEHFWK